MILDYHFDHKGLKEKLALKGFGSHFKADSDLSPYTKKPDIRIHSHPKDQHKSGNGIIFS